MCERCDHLESAAGYLNRDDTPIKANHQEEKVLIRESSPFDVTISGSAIAPPLGIIFDHVKESKCTPLDMKKGFIDEKAACEEGSISSDPLYQEFNACSQTVETTRIPMLLQSLRRNMVEVLTEIYFVEPPPNVETWDQTQWVGWEEQSEQEKLLFEYHKVKIMSSFSLTDFRDYLLVLMPLLSKFHEKTGTNIVSVREMIRYQLEFIKNRRKMTDKIQNSIDDRKSLDLLGWLLPEKSRIESISNLANQGQIAANDGFPYLCALEFKTFNKPPTSEDNIFERVVRTNELIKITEEAGGTLYESDMESTNDERVAPQSQGDTPPYHPFSSFDRFSCASHLSSKESVVLDGSPSAEEQPSDSLSFCANGVGSFRPRIYLNKGATAWLVIWRDGGYEMQRRFSIEQLGSAEAKFQAEVFVEELVDSLIHGCHPDRSVSNASKLRKSKTATLPLLSNGAEAVVQPDGAAADVDFSRPVAPVRPMLLRKGEEVPYEGLNDVEGAHNGVLSYNKRRYRKAASSEPLHSRRPINGSIHKVKREVMFSHATSVEYDAQREGWTSFYPDKHGMMQSKFFACAEHGYERAKALAFSWKRTLDKRRMHPITTRGRPPSTVPATGKRPPGRPAGSGSKKAYVRRSEAAKQASSMDLPKVTLGQEGPPGGVANLSKASAGILYRQNASSSRIERLSLRAMNFPYVHGVSFEAENFAWLAKMGVETRRFLVKKYGWEKARLCAIERIEYWRKLLDPDWLAKELQMEQEFLQAIASGEIHSLLGDKKGGAGAQVSEHYTSHTKVGTNGVEGNVGADEAPSIAKRPSVVVGAAEVPDTEWFRGSAKRKHTQSESLKRFYTSCTTEAQSNSESLDSVF